MTEKPALIRMHVTAKDKSRLVVSAKRMKLTLTDYILLCCSHFARFDDEQPKPQPKPPGKNEQ